ncbi:DNA-binding protein [Actinoplanes sp. NPDC051861]|uniref:helix-turn-helix transcriptional regulator n=1 Tax=Actinoplanes sp. NPDC051861 TaxID=3155170 RepID=UPI0034124619
MNVSGRLMSVAEIARRLGVGRTWAGRLTRRDGFPAPFDELACGRIWLAGDVEIWIAKHRPHLVQPIE